MHDDSRKDDGIDWEWSSLAAALPVYSGQDGTLAGTSQGSSRDEQQPAPISQEYPAQNPIGPAAAPQHTKSALTGLLSKSTPSQAETSNSTAKISWQDKSEERTSSERSQPQQQGSSGGTAKSAAGTGQGGGPAVSKSCAAVGVPASPQHRAQTVRAQERPNVVSPIACSTDKASSMPLSPKHEGHKPTASAAHAVPHHKGGSPRTPMRAPSRKGDFLSQSPGQAAFASSGGGGGRDDRADQAAAIMMLNQLVANAHAHGAN